MVLWFLFLIQNRDGGYLLELPQRGGSNVYPQLMFGATVSKMSKFFSMKFSIFAPEKTLCLLHGQILVKKSSLICFCTQRYLLLYSTGAHLNAVLLTVMHLCFSYFSNYCLVLKASCANNLKNRWETKEVIKIPD